MQEYMRLSSKWLTWLCLSLTLWTAVAESTHNHPNKTESASCSICVLAHSTTPTATADQIRPVYAEVGFLPEDEIIAKARLAVADLDIRGPPTV